jgi:regulator of sirC expression with transglutaminase-like and TPR domain
MYLIIGLFPLLTMHAHEISNSAHEEDELEISLAPESEEAHRQALRARIQPSSLKDLLLFSSLYPDTIEGKASLQQAWKILSGQITDSPPPLPPDFELNVTALVRLIQPGAIPQSNTPEVPQETISLIDTIGASLPHRKLKGHLAQSLHEIKDLPPEEIDLARALILLDTENPGALAPVEAALDVLALELLARTGKEADEETKISALTNLLFYELGIRFPPQSEASEKTQQFSDLSSVLFSRRGVCLGASVLYLTLAQRIGVDLSIYTPPGHIFVAHKTKTRTRVIETTARGIDIPIDQYLGLTLKSLPEKTMKEVIGMVIFNKTSHFLKERRWEEALQSYQKARIFESGEEVHQMISLCELLNGNEKASRKAATEALARIPEYLLEPDLLLVDLSAGTLSKKAAEAIIEFSDAEGEELVHAIDVLKSVNGECKNSFVVPFHLAHAWLSYGKPKEAIPLLEKLCSREDALCSIHALLAYLYLERMNITGAWKEADLSIRKAKKQGVLPRPLYQLIIELQQESPHCIDISDLIVSQTSTTK